MKGEAHEAKSGYSGRLLVRAVMRAMLYPACAALCDLQLSGRENLPEEGPLLVAFNHFSFVDPAVILRAIPGPIEFLGGMQTPNAPPQLRWIIGLWGYLPVQRGTGARAALRAALDLLRQRGVVGIAPEGGAGAAILRPARPGTAYLAVKSEARVLPVGIDGAPQVFPRLRKGRLARVTVRIGKPVGPFQVSGRGREQRQQLDEIGHAIMRRIADLIPRERRGYYSQDLVLRGEAERLAYHWDAEPEIAG